MYLTIALIIGLLSALYVFLVWNFGYFKKRGIIGPKPLPYVGTYYGSSLFKWNICYDVEKTYKEFKGKAPFIGTFSGRTPQIFALDNNFVKDVLIRNFKSFHDNEFAGWVDKETDPIFSRNPFMLTGEEWREKRAEITPALTTARLSARYTINVVSNCIYGLDARTFVDDKSIIREMASGLFSSSIGQFIYIFVATFLPFVRKIYKMPVVSKKIQNFFESIMRDAVAMRERTQLKRDDFLGYLLQLRKRKPITDLEMVAHTISFFLDGYETSSVVMSHVLYQLGKHEDVQEKLRAEIRENCDENGAVTYEKVQDMTYLDQVYSETLRLQPPAFAIGKVCTETIEVEYIKEKKVTIEKGTIVLLPYGAIGMDPEHYPNPNKFDPDRFHPDNGGVKAYRDKGVFLSFGDGPRICLGMKFAGTQIKAGIIELVKNFEISANPRTKEPLRIGVTDFFNYPIGGLWIGFKKLPANFTFIIIIHLNGYTGHVVITNPQPSGGIKDPPVNISIPVTTPFIAAQPTKSTNSSTDPLLTPSSLQQSSTSPSTFTSCAISTAHLIEHYPDAADIIVSILTTNKYLSLKWLIHRINELYNVDHNNQHLPNGATIGIRIIYVENRTTAPIDLLDEIQYHQRCCTAPIGILVDTDLWATTQSIIEDIDYNVWKLPNQMDYRYEMMNRLLYDLSIGGPIRNTKSTVKILTGTQSEKDQFLKIAGRNHLCFRYFDVDMMEGKHSPDVVVVIGDNGMKKLMDYDKWNGSTKIFWIAGQENGDCKNRLDDSLIKDIPNGTFTFTESTVPIKPTNNDPSNEFDTKQTIQSTNLIVFGTIFIQLAKWIKQTMIKNDCQTIVDCSESITIQWPYDIKVYTAGSILRTLQLNDMTNQLTFDLIQIHRINLPANQSIIDRKLIASINFVTNVTTIYRYQSTDVGQLKFSERFGCPAPNRSEHRNLFTDMDMFYWRLKSDAWVAAGITISTLGILISMAILTFIIVRLCMEDVLEGNPIGTIMLLLSIIFLFLSFAPFAVEYVPYGRPYSISDETFAIQSALCTVKIFLITLCYCSTFSLLLCRGIMLASIGSEGGFLSHVNGYIQSMICLFSSLVQIGLSTQFLIVMNAAHQSISCHEIFYGHWLWAMLAYDASLLLFLVFVSPLIFRSQRNYREGVLILSGATLCLAVWGTWIPLCTFGDRWRDAALPLGALATGWAILGGILIPRCFLIVKGIARTDLAQALPSLTSLAFAHNNQYASEQSIYECVNPAMRQRHVDDTVGDPTGRCQSPSEIPTLPLRGASRKQHQNPMSYCSSDETTLPSQSPNKATRF